MSQHGSQVKARVLQNLLASLITTSLNTGRLSVDIELLEGLIQVTPVPRELRTTRLVRALPSTSINKELDVA